jgi:hypothetical protein
MRRFYLALLALLLSVAAEPLVAATYYVGNCRVGAFGTINAAVAAVPAGSTIDVCPGTYAEQVVISKALTLKGIFSNNSTQAIIAMPSAALAASPSLLWGTVVPQVWITAGPVNITNITVDGTTTMNCPGAKTVGIFYSSGSAGTVNEVEARNQNCSGAGLGILAENGVGAIQAVKIENNNIHDISRAGISTCSDQTPSTLTATITGNYVAAGVVGIFPYCNAGGTVSSNIVTGGSIGVYAGSASTTVSGNTIIGAGYAGVAVTKAASVISNHITGSSNGILLDSGGATIKTNFITKSNIGVEFACFAGTVTGNTINGATTGFDQVPAAFNGVNKFYNVPTVRVAGGC